ncbi:MAG: hypothetical protein RL748_3999, partial [Pseudomonadota bacterium]
MKNTGKIFIPLMLAHSLAFAATGELQVGLAIPPTSAFAAQQAGLTQINLSKPNVVQACVQNGKDSHCKTLRMPKATGKTLRVEMAPPLQGGQVAWLTFSKLRANLCTLKPTNNRVICQKLLLANLPFGDIQVQRNDNFKYSLKFQFSAPEEVPLTHLQTYIKGFSAEIVRAKTALESKLANPKEGTASVIGTGCPGESDDTDYENGGDCGGEGSGGDVGDAGDAGDA